MTVPFGGPDGLCTPQFGGASNGITTCLVNEGQGDSLLELVINFTGVNIVINNVTSGPINFIAGDRTDLILTDPIAAGINGPIAAGPFGVLNTVDCLTKPTLLPGGSCTFIQSFTTDAPEAGPPMDGESTKSFILGITPVAALTTACGNGVGQALGPTALGLQYCFGANPTPADGRGSLLVQITSADVVVNDLPAPEPPALSLIGGCLLLAGALRRRYVPSA